MILKYASESNAERDINPIVFASGGHELSLVTSSTILLNT